MSLLNPNTGLGQMSSALAAGTNESFLPFDEERYVFMRPDGTTVALTDDMLLLPQVIQYYRYKV